MELNKWPNNIKPDQEVGTLFFQPFEKMGTMKKSLGNT